MDIKRVASQALNRATLLLSDWLPGGKLIGKEWTCGDLSGSAGDSCKVNIDTGKWCDFATGDKGGDLVSLYAKIHNIKQSDAATRVAELIGYTNGKATTDKPYPTPETKRPSVIAPPKGTKLPNMLNKTHGEPEAVYKYTDAGGQVLFLVARYANKQFTPFTYTSDGKWQRKAYPSPRPLFGLSELKKFVLIVEGEKTAIAARKFASSKYCVVTWPNGSNSTDKTDWSPLYNRDILIWPDHDEPGRKAAASIASQLLTHCPTVKIISTINDDLPDGWDAADSDFTWETFLKWAKPRAKQVSVPIKPTATNISDTDAPPMPTEPYSNTNILIAGDDAVNDLTFKVSPNVSANIARCNLLQGSTRPYKNIANVTRVLSKDFESRIWFDEFHDSIMTNIEGESEKWADKHLYSFTIMLQTNYGLFDISHETVFRGVEAFALLNVRNEPRDWFESLVWDNTPRVESFFHTYMGAPDTDYSRAVAKNFWVSMIARTYKPGCKADAMVIFEGPQGTYKSTALEAIAGKWFTETNTSPTDKDFYLVMHGALLIEIAELDSFSRAETNTIKKVVSCHTDRYRAPYGRHVKDYPRRCVFAGTTNTDDYLKDSTGARRFWPISTNKIDVSGIKSMRDQLFAEAISLYKSGYKWHSVPVNEAKDEQAKRYDQDIWTNAVLDYTLGKKEISIEEILVNALKIDIGKIDQRSKNRVSKILQASGFSCRVSKKQGRSLRVYENPTWNEPSQKSLPSFAHKTVRNYAPGADDFM